MKKRVLSILLAAALLCSPVLASGSHAVTAEFDSALGSVALETDKGVAGDNIYFTVTPSAMYTPENPKITTASGSAVQCYASGSENGVYKYYFSMPDDAVTINVTFTPAEGPFDDVAATDWFCDEVLDAYEAGLMTGTGERTFSPGAPATRAMLVTILYRLAGEPAAEGGGFTDVSASAYYASAVAWASQNGIVEGFEDGSFQPDAAITREQLAAVLYRYATWKGADTSASGELTDFADAASVSSWAQAAMKWAVGAGILSGSAAGLEPQGTATRAQAAAMLVRFTQTVSQ
mgnify:CR=1 FL=1